MACNKCKKKPSKGNYEEQKKLAIELSNRLNKGIFLYKEQNNKAINYYFVECFECVPDEATNVEFIY